MFVLLFLVLGASIPCANTTVVRADVHSKLLSEEEEIPLKNSAIHKNVMLPSQTAVDMFSL